MPASTSATVEALFEATGPPRPRVGINQSTGSKDMKGGLRLNTIAQEMLNSEVALGGGIGSGLGTTICAGDDALELLPKRTPVKFRAHRWSFPAVQQPVPGLAARLSKASSGITRKTESEQRPRSGRWQQPVKRWQLSACGVNLLAFDVAALSDEREVLTLPPRLSPGTLDPRLASGRDDRSCCTTSR